MDGEGDVVRIGDSLPTDELRTAAGHAVDLGAYLDRILVIQCLRYYG
ncbi:MAG: hypothetical protein ABR540_06275 [Acidimicrobiales bacterium]